MNIDMAIKSAKWLCSLPNIINVYPVEVNLHDTIYYGSRYSFIGRYTYDMMAVIWGKKKTGDTYRDERLLLIGPLPKQYLRDKHVVYLFEGGEWYVTCHYSGNKNEWHPFGKHFILGLWNSPGKVDDNRYDKKGYKVTSKRIIIEAKMINETNPNG